MPGTKQRKSKKGGRRPRRSAAKKMRKEYLKEVEIVPTTVINLNTPYLQIKNGITGTRATALAKLFGEYRIKKIIWTYRPLFDTYSSSLAGVGNSPNSVPTLYWRMNRYGDTPAAFNGDYMRAMGATPKRLDDKQVTFSYSPNIIQSQQNTAGTTAASIKVSPWLSTDDLVNDNNFNLSTALHFGHSMFVEGGGAGNGQGAVCYQDVKVIYEFRNPRLTAVPGVSVNPLTGLEEPVPQAVVLKV